MQKVWHLKHFLVEDDAVASRDRYLEILEELDDLLVRRLHLLLEKNEDQVVDPFDSQVDSCLVQVLEWLERRLVDSVSGPILTLMPLSSAIKNVFALVCRLVYMLVAAFGGARIVPMAVALPTACVLTGFAVRAELFVFCNSLLVASLAILLQLLHGDLFFIIFLIFAGCAANTFEILVQLTIRSYLASLACAGLQLSWRHHDLFRMLSHLLATNDLAEAIVEVLLVKDLRLRPADEDLADQLRLLGLVPLAVSRLLSLGAVSLTLRAFEIHCLSVCLSQKVDHRLPVFQHVTLRCKSRYTLVLLAVRRCAILCSAVAVGAVEGIATPPSFATLALVALHVVAQLFLEHEAGHLDAFRAVKASIGLLIIFLIFRLISYSVL